MSALRKTLPTDERAVFDQIIPAEDEVQRHQVGQETCHQGRAKAGSGSDRPQVAKTKSIKGSASKKAPEVTAHRFTKGKAKQTSNAKSEEGAVK